MVKEATSNPKKNLKISVVTVCYNAVATIEETILSVINQTYRNIEYIIIDGGSTDGTVDIIKKYSDNIAYWISEPDKGIYDAMNKGIRVATGDYIYFIGADDTLYCDSVITDVKRDIINKRTIYYGNSLFSTGKIYDGKFSKWKLVRKNICHQSIFYPAQILKKNIYDQYYPIYADYVLNLSLWGKNYNFVFLNQIICKFNVLGSSSKGDNNFKSDRFLIIYRSLGLLPAIFSEIVHCLTCLKNGVFTK